MQLLVDPLHVGAHRRCRDPEPLGDLLVGKALDEQLEHLLLPGRERLVIGRGSRICGYSWRPCGGCARGLSGLAAAKRLDHLSRDRAAHRHAAGPDLADRLQEPLREHRLHKIAVGAGGQRLKRRVGILIDRHHQDLRGGKLGREYLHALDPRGVG